MTNIIKNSGFEQGTANNWQVIATGTVHQFLYPETGSLTGYSVGISYATRETGKKASWVQTVDLSRRYKLSGKIKTDNIISDNVDGGATIIVEWKDSTGNIIGTEKIPVQKGTVGWTPFEKEIISPANAIKASVSGMIYDASGKAWFDDVMLDSI